MMPNREFRDLLPTIQENLPGCPEPTILEHIRRAAIKVCERTTAWRAELPLATLIPGVHEYPYQAPEGTEVHVVFGAVLNDKLMDMLTLEEAIARYPAWADLYSGMGSEEIWAETPSGTFNAYAFNEAYFNGEPSFQMPAGAVSDGGVPKVFTQLTPNRFIVIPLPDSEQPYRLRLFVSLKPRRDALGMERDMFNELEETITHCALQQLFVLPNQNWQDLELAAYHARQYLFAVTERRARANVGNARATLVAKPQVFG